MSEKHPNFLTVCPVAVKLSHADGRMDGQEN
jgi:hypothetical protein